ncbi:hypothetical protein PO124_30685 [Bacillus licheniformis]|nr:hypothetical protein [Bacillus licheniformis]
MYVYSASVLPGMIPWFVILLSHIGFRKAKELKLTNIRSNAFRPSDELFDDWFPSYGIGGHVVQQ